MMEKDIKDLFLEFEICRDQIKEKKAISTLEKLHLEGYLVSFTTDDIKNYLLDKSSSYIFEFFETVYNIFKKGPVLNDNLDNIVDRLSTYSFIFDKGKVSGVLYPHYCSEEYKNIENRISKCINKYEIIKNKNNDLTTGAIEFYKLFEEFVNSNKYNNNYLNYIIAKAFDSKVDLFLGYLSEEQIRNIKEYYKSLKIQKDKIYDKSNIDTNNGFFTEMSNDLYDYFISIYQSEDMSEYVKSELIGEIYSKIDLYPGLFTKWQEKIIRNAYFVFNKKGLIDDKYIGEEQLSENALDDITKKYKDADPISINSLLKSHTLVDKGGVFDGHTEKKVRSDEYIKNEYIENGFNTDVSVELLNSNRAAWNIISTQRRKNFGNKNYYHVYWSTNDKVHVTNNYISEDLTVIEAAKKYGNDENFLRELNFLLSLPLDTTIDFYFKVEEKSKKKIL